MTETCMKSEWLDTKEHIETIIIPAMKNIAKQCDCYVEKLRCSPSFVAVILKDIADTFEDRQPEAKK